MENADMLWYQVFMGRFYKAEYTGLWDVYYLPNFNVYQVIIVNGIFVSYNEM